MSFDRGRPSALTLRWVERSLGGSTRVVAWRRMTGGISSAVHRLTIDQGSSQDAVVLRRYDRAHAGTAAMVRREAANLRALHDTGVAAPQLIAADVSGARLDGRPTILMTRLPGRLDLTPADPEGWVRQIAATAVAIHDLCIAAEPIEGRVDAATPTIPSSATRPDVWKTAFGILRERAPDHTAGFVHGDFQHFNLLWLRERLSGVVDWTASGTGPADLDIGHCRLNLAVLFGTDRAEQFRLAYEAEAGRVIDPWWELHAVTAYSDDWRRFIPLQVAGRTPVDGDGMTDRVEQLLEAILRRL